MPPQAKREAVATIAPRPEAQQVMDHVRRTWQNIRDNLGGRREELERLASELKDSQRQLKEIEARREEEIRQVRQGSEEQLIVLKDCYESFRTESNIRREALQRRNEELRLHIDQLSAELELEQRRASKDKGALQDELEKVKRTLKSVRCRTTWSEKQVKLAEDRADQYKAKVMELEAEIDTVNAENAVLQDQLAVTKASLEMETKRREEQEEAFAKEKEDLLRANAEMRERYDDAVDSFEMEQEEVSKAKREAENAKREAQEARKSNRKATPTGKAPPKKAAGKRGRPRKDRSVRVAG